LPAVAPPGDGEQFSTVAFARHRADGCGAGRQIR
jgi:hypothetical protein